MRPSPESNSADLEKPASAGIRKGDVLTVEVERFADRGKSLAKSDGLVIFVRGGVPGDKARIGITRRRKRFVEGRIEELLEASPLRTDPACKYFGTCGGCTWQHVNYGSQLEAKHASVRDALTRTAGYTDVQVSPVIGADPIFRYRNKMEFSCSSRRWLTDWEISSGESYDRNLAIGMHASGHFDRVIDLSECHLVSEKGMAVVAGIRDLARREEWPAWHPRKHRGFLRHVVLRVPENTDDFMVNLVTSSIDENRMALLAELLQSEFPFVTTLVNTINTTPAQTAFGQQAGVVFGSGLVTERIGGYDFQIGPATFFQTNTRQTERLYATALECADLQGEEHVYDLYCGGGAISLFVSGHAKSVVGIELVPEAVRDAKGNAKRNGVSNCTFVKGDMRRVLNPDLLAKHGRPDVVIVDPPRAGMHPKVVEQLAIVRPTRLVYVSCNPQTQARDLASLHELYDIERVQPVDLFPHTYHIENVVGLRVKQSADVG